MRRFLALGLLLLLTGCPDAELTEVQRELVEQKARWEAAAPAHYQYTFQWICYCPPEYTAPVQIAVKDGTVASVTVIETGERLSTEHLADYHSVEGLFTYLQRAVDRGPAAISVTYDTSGYPERADIDYRANVSDDEISFTASTLLERSD